MWVSITRGFSIDFKLYTPQNTTILLIGHMRKATHLSSQLRKPSGLGLPSDLLTWWTGGNPSANHTLAQNLDYAIIITQIPST